MHLQAGTDYLEHLRMPLVDEGLFFRGQFTGLHLTNPAGLEKMEARKDGKAHGELKHYNQEPGEFNPR